MNKDQYYKALARDPMWAKNNVVQINTEFILGTDLVQSQIRQGDIISSHVSDLVDSIFERGQRIPITVEIDDTKNEKGQTVYRPVDGMHRLEAISKLAKQYPDSAGYKFIDAEIKEFSTNSDRVLYQIECNGHDDLPAKSNSDADATLVINQVANGALKGLAPELQGQNAEEMNRTMPKQYREALIKFVKQTFGWTSKNSSRTVDKFLKKLPGKLKNYTSDSVLKEFASHVKQYPPNDMRITVKRNRGKEKVEFPEAKIFKLGNIKHVFPNVTGNTFKAKTEESENTSVVVVWDNDTIGKDFSDLDRIRKDTIEKLNKANASDLLKRGRNLVDRVFIAPQKLNEKNGKAPLEKGFMEVVKNSKGHFTTELPGCGWDTTKQEED